MLTLPNTGATEREVHQRIRELIEGRSNAIGTVTLTANVGTTTVTKRTINANAAVFLFPVTASAATEFAAGTLRAAVATGGGSFVITHVNSATADRTFSYLVIGG